MFVYVVNHEHQFTDVVGVYASETEAKIAAEKYVDWTKIQFKKIEADQDKKDKNGNIIFKLCRKTLYSNDTDLITINIINMKM